MKRVTDGYICDTLEDKKYREKEQFRQEQSNAEAFICAILRLNLEHRRPSKPGSGRRIVEREALFHRDQRYPGCHDWAYF